MSTLALIGLGSNLGDRKATLEAAAAALRESPGITVRAVSPFHETEAVGGPTGQGTFLNAAAALETTLDPASLLHRLREIEARLGRVRTVRWGERTLDLDLLLLGDEIIDTPNLTVPHLRMAVRRFVLAPLAEVAPEAVDPLTRQTVRDLLANLDRRPGLIAFSHSVADPLLSSRLAQELDAVSYSWCKSNNNKELWPYAWLQQVKSLEPAGLSQSSLVMELRDALNRGLRGDRWVLTDIWVDEAIPDLTPRFRDGGVPDDIAGAAIQELRSQLRPTFVVVAGAEADESLTDWAEKNHPAYPIGCDVPILRLRTLASEQISGPVQRERMLAEILAACASAGS
jgi:2-amino-4-hydroxy-6-hydroxymethyldihydropteridine diphosphokinase